ncbi:PrsW family glutamic-type intramembrane protease [Streptomyces sp. NPDC058665]|uniref:PrsW family glutamic-type intramembrane protease n=1 Tax=Streptomyces sp. NPDC058665 TaxID=3346586 RepID=UPI00366877E6
MTALLQLAYTRLYSDWSGQPLAQVVSSTGYTVAPWLEELAKVSPLLLAGLSLKVRTQWGLTDFVVLGGALGAGFGLLEGVLRFGLDADRAIPHAAGGWVVPDSIFPPYVPGPEQVFGAWLPAPFGEAARQWLDELDAKAWAVPLVCLLVALAVDLRVLHRGKRTVPGVLLSAERADGDSVAALLRYSSWSLSRRGAWRRIPWSVLIVLRYVGLRRALLYAAAVGRAEQTEPLRGAVADATARMDASDHGDAGVPRSYEPGSCRAPGLRGADGCSSSPAYWRYPRCSSSESVPSSPRRGFRTSSPPATAPTS